MAGQDSPFRDAGGRGPAGKSLKIFTGSMREMQKTRRRLIDEVRNACARLADAGWRDLMQQHGLDIEAKDLAHELARPLDGIDRSLPGFEDFAREGVRGIEPGKPAHSLLFHAFASPQVVERRSRGQCIAMKEFPTQAEIETVEDYLYGARALSIEDLRAQAGGAHLAIVVFAAEYRPAIDTVHRKHADMCYARSGVARVGTMEAKYLPEARGYLPFVDEDPHQFRVLPCGYAAYIAALLPGKKHGHGPLRFLELEEKPAAASSRRAMDAGLAAPPPALQSRRIGDASRNFWIPLHKLFDGEECIRGRNLTVRLSANHVNEKIRRAHLFFGANGHYGGWSEPEISKPPFIFTDGIATFSQNVDSDGSWLLVPFPHRRLIEPAKLNGKPLTYVVPETTDLDGPWRPFHSTLNLRPKPSGARGAPEYLHARHEIDQAGKEIDLNKAPHVIDVVKKGGYRARHYVDFTGDGWIDVECSQLALEVPRRLPAYSIVATPHFFPAVKQSDLMQWTDQSVPPPLLKTIWPENPGKPEALSDQRFAANLELAGGGFDKADDTMTAIVGQFGSGNGHLTQLDRPRNQRASTLTDAAAGVFAPGWDVSYDRTSEADATDTGGELSQGTTFLTTYGLGSPFVEDSKLCAALSSFWPAAAPDVTRTFGPNPRYATATPLTDDVIGLDSQEPWDAIKGPQVDEAAKIVEYKALAYGDYVQTALDGGFNIKTIGATTVEEYVARTLTMARVYNALQANSREEKAKWSLLSFRRAESSDLDLKAAMKATGRKVQWGFTYRFKMFQHNNVTREDAKKFDKVLVPYDTMVLLFADPSIVLQQLPDGTWKVYELRR